MEQQLVAPETVKVIEHMMGKYGWFALFAFIALLFKDAVHKAAEGFMVWIGSDFSNDDILYISGRQARIVRVGFLKSIFYMSDRGTKMIVPNDRLKLLVVEKQLPKNGSYPYLYKAGEPGYEDQVEKLKVKDHIAEIVMDLKDENKDKN
tara:strand:+ start:1632 stop:2078 length:447 start_codon:yes stop_codon:yes gene_type:complete